MDAILLILHVVVCVLSLNESDANGRCPQEWQVSTSLERNMAFQLFTHCERKYYVQLYPRAQVPDLSCTSRGGAVPYCPGDWTELIQSYPVFMGTAYLVNKRGTYLFLAIFNFSLNIKLCRRSRRSPENRRL